jgi:putative transposase
MGIRVSQPTIQKVLREHGYHPRGHSRSWEKFKSFACDALWAMDYLSVRTIRGTWLHVLLVIDLYSRELMELRAFDGWEADSAWTVTALADAMARERRRPRAVLHDHGPHFLGQFERQLRVLEIDDRLAPAKLAFVNGCAERAIKSVRMELLNHVRVAGVSELQWYLDEYRSYYRTERAHQAIGGQTPDAFGRGEELGDLVPVEWLRRRRLVQRQRAHGLLNSYVLAEAGGDDGIRAAA